jgi:preprotein translocase subunit SecE
MRQELANNLVIVITVLALILVIIFALIQAN